MNTEQAAETKLGYREQASLLCGLTQTEVLDVVLGQTGKVGSRRLRVCSLW